MGMTNQNNFRRRHSSAESDESVADTTDHSDVEIRIGTLQVRVQMGFVGNSNGNNVIFFTG